MALFFSLPKKQPKAFKSFKGKFYTIQVTAPRIAKDSVQPSTAVQDKQHQVEKWDILVQFRKWWIRLKAKAHLKMKNAFVLSDLLSCYLSILFVCELLSFCNIIYGNVSHLSNTMASKTTKMSPFRSCDLVSQKKNTNLVVSSFGSHY